MLREMVASWRAIFSATPGTTDPLAPFGIATLPYWEAEGSPQNMGVHYMAHLANHGVLPNDDLPNTFMASGYDIGDPWESQHCDSWKCCVPPWEPLGGQCWEDHRGEWDNRTPYFMGGIHARTKLEMGWRFAHGAFYGAGYGNASSPAIGPVIAGCALAADRSTLTIAFNASLLRGLPVVVNPNFGKLPAADGNLTTETSLTYVLVNVSLPDAVDHGARMNKGGPGPYGYWPWEGGNTFFPGPWPNIGSSPQGELPGPGWVAVQVAAGARPNEVTIDLTKYPQLAGLPRPDAILPFFIAHELPAGVAGLVVAGVFAAAQSAISTSLNATSTVIVTDFLQRLGPSRSDAHWLHAAKVITAGAGVAAVALAGVLAFAGVGSAFDFFQGLLGLTASGLAGLFILGIFTRRATTAGAMIGAIASALVLYFVQTRMAVQVYL